MRTIADSLNIPASTTHSHLLQKIRFTSSLLLWVPHVLTGQLRQKRVEPAGQLLQILEGQQRVGFCDIVIGDKS
jgi:hypothetical protein